VVDRFISELEFGDPLEDDAPQFDQNGIIRHKVSSLLDHLQCDTQGFNSGP
jgi:hypothetical protein